MFSFDPYSLTLGPPAWDATATTQLRWVDDAAAQTPLWTLDHRQTNRLVIRNATTDTDVAWVADDDVFHVRDLAIEGTSGIDAGTLDGLDSSQFVRTDADTTVAASLNITGTLSETGNAVLTTADEGSLDAGTLAGQTLTQTRPSLSDDGTVTVAGPSDINAGQYLQVTDNGDGTVTLDSLGGNAVGTTATRSGDGTTAAFTLTHGLGTIPAGVDVTPLTEDAAADRYISNITATDLTVTYSGPPPAGTDNLEWSVTAVGNDGSGKHAVEVQDDGTQVDLATTLDFGTGLTISNPSDGHATIDTAIGVSDDDATVVAGAVDLNFGANLDVTDDGDNTVTIAGSDTYPSVSNGGTQVLATPSDINAGDNLTAVDDGDGTTTLHASGDAATLGGISPDQFLRGDAADTHTGTLTLTTLGGANGAGNVGLAAGVNLEPAVGHGLVNTANNATHRLRPQRNGLQALTQGANLPTDHGLTVEADATIAFVETDNDRVTGWVDTNTESLTMAGGVRVGDAGGAPQAALDVRGAVAFNEQSVTGFCAEVRSDDPANPAAGRLWVNTSAT